MEDNNNLLRHKAKELVSLMTLEEKASLCSGKDCWTLESIKRLGLDSIVMMDGPHGLRKQIGEGDNLGIGDSIPSVCFPTASATACSFDRELLYEIGEALGEECLQEGVSVILGPGVNQKRSPLCGRNFEYFSEDPVVSGELGASMIQGVQSKGISTSLKHFAANNQEKRRMTINAVIDERALRELYLKAFEIAVKKGKPDTVMCAYNKLNGKYCSENKELLIDILRKDWGFEGAVISDWGAVHDRPLGVKNGLDLEMPGSNGYNDAKVIKAVKSGLLSMEELEQAAYRVIKLILKGNQNKKEGYQYDVEKHHLLAVKAAEQSTVLLKNEGDILPGNRLQNAAVIGRFAKEPRYQGAGSSKLHPIQVDNAWDALQNLGLHASYSEGYSNTISSDKDISENDRLIKEACEIAKGKDIVYIFAGLTEGYESEGFDRHDMSLPQEHNRLIETVCEYNQNVVVILFGGAPMELTWLPKVKAVLLGYLGGEGGGSAIANLLLGICVPCAKLAETWPMKQEDVPAYQYFPGGRLTVEHRESIYVGYRYYEKANKTVQFSFGHGLSYTKFNYSDMKINQNKFEYGEKIQVTFDITNIGNVAAREISFLFVSHESNQIFLPKKELKEFVKTKLMPGETKEISISLDTSTFGYFNTIIHDWYAESGIYELIVGGSLKDCALRATIYMTSPQKQQPNLREIAPSYFDLKEEVPFEISNQEFEALYGAKLPLNNSLAARPFTQDNTLEDVSHTLIGKIINWYAERLAKQVTKGSKEQEGMMAATIKEMPFFAMVASGEGMLSENMMFGLLDLLNGHYVRGIKNLLKRDR